MKDARFVAWTGPTWFLQPVDVSFAHGKLLIDGRDFGLCASLSFKREQLRSPHHFSIMKGAKTLVTLTAARINEIADVFRCNCRLPQTIQ